MLKVISSLTLEKPVAWWVLMLLSATGMEILLPAEILASSIGGELTALYSAPLMITNATANSAPLYYWPITLYPEDSSATPPQTNPSLYPKTQFERNAGEQSKFSSGKTPNSYESKYYFDSTAQVLRRRESVQNIDMGIPRSYTLDEYLSRRRNFLQNRVWDSLLTSYDLSKANSGDALANAISKATGFTIPIPPNPLTTIFGKPEIGINVSGEVNVRAGWRWDSQNLGTVSAFGSTQSSPVFSQDINLNVSGRIGDKLKLGVDYNTRRQFEFDNRFKIGFDGYDDDIIKRIELGNVNLPIPQATLIGGGQTLFGARADLQFGPLFLKTIASQRRGERKFVNVKGGSLKQRFALRAYDYAQNHFLVDTAYKTVWELYYKNSTPIIPPDALSLNIKEIQVWESTSDVREQATAADVVAHADLPSIKPLDPTSTNRNYDQSWRTVSDIRPGVVAKGKFVLLDSTRYFVNRSLGRISINNLRTDRTYAVAYRVEGGGSQKEDDLQYGTINTNTGIKDTLVLKLVYVPNLQPGFRTLWSRQLKNIYWIGSTNVNIAETNIGIWYFRQTNDSSDIMPSTQDKVVSVLGVDRVTNGTSEQTPDGRFDMMEPSPYFDARRGEIVFPSLEPFRQQLRKYFAEKKNDSNLANPFVFDAVYDTNVVVARQQTTRDRFVISGEMSGTAGNRIALGAFNLTQGSVRVTLDGSPLREGEDYTVEYYTGQLTIRNPRASLPNTNLSIEYESPDVFNLATKTLAGVRADIEPYKSRTIRSNLGGTFMHYDQALLIDRVRIGDEPVSNSMIGFDGQVQMDAMWLTKALDALPFLDTKEKSALNLRGEWAQMLPTPNKKLSDVSSDRGLPVVYIDDFESAQRQISLGLSPAQWTHASQPQDSSIAAHDTLRAHYRGKSYWYQYFLGRVPVTEVYPNKPSVPGRTTINPLLINFDPATRGIYNRNENFLDSLDEGYMANAPLYEQWKSNNRGQIWGGMMRLLSSYSINFDAENIDYIEIMMKVDERDPDTRMFVDIGQISEDVIPNQNLNTEDGITDPNPVPNNIIDEGEDVGLDGLSNADEANPNFYPSTFSRNDPARDDYSFNFTNRDQSEKDFLNYNNYQGNASAETGQFPDTEILNRNNGQQVALDNSYFSYEIRLAADAQTNAGNPQIVGGANNWYLYRIPVRGARREVGTPLFSNIQYARVWFKGGKLKAQIAEWRFLGSQWQRVHAFQPGLRENDSVLKVAFINREENSGAPDYYTMPPGVSPPRQLSNPDPSQDVRLNEHSIAVSVRDLRYGEERMTVRVFRPFDMFYYKKLKFFIHGDGSMPDNVASFDQAPAQVFMRFGIDSLNYYEYRRPLLRDWQDIEIDLAALTAIKQGRKDQLGLEREEFPVPGDPLAKFIIKGNPTLTKVLFVGYGIANPSNRFPNELTTTMWVDELRLIDPESSNDWAAVASADMKLADLGTVVATFNRTNPNFHKLEDRFGNRVESSNWSVTTQGGLEKFLPKEFKETKIPVTYTHTEYYEKPQFAAQNDINLNEAANLAYQQATQQGATPELAQAAADAVQVRSQTLRVQDSWALTGLKLGIPVENWLIRDTFNKLVFGYSYAQSYERTPVVTERFDWRWQLNTQYAITLSPDFYFDPLRWLADVPGLSAYKDARISYLPSNLSAGITLNRGRITEQSRFLDFPSPVIRNFTAQKQLAFTWRLIQNSFLSPTIDYSLNSQSTLAPLEMDENNRQRTGSEIFGQMFGGNGRAFNFGDETRYQQNVTINFKPKLPEFGSINKFFDATGAYIANYTWSDPLQQDPTLRDVSKSAQVNSQFRINNTLRLKAMSNAWFGERPAAGKPDTASRGVLGTIGNIFRTVFFDYDNMTLSMRQENNSNNPGVIGGTGITNFWTRGLLFREERAIFGPSMAYQLGLVESPFGGFSIKPSSAFPFFKFETHPGLRPPNAIMSESFSQATTLEARTNRPLWEGATLDLNWRSQFAYNKTQTVVSNPQGIPSFQNVAATQNYNRSYFHIPSFLLFGLGNNTVENVVNLYRERSAEIDANGDADTVRRNQEKLLALTESFRDGLESANFWPAALRAIMPAVNWSIRWEGIEKWDLWSGLAKRISLEHTYGSTYTENASLTDNGRIIQGQQVQYGFQPLVGISMGFDEKPLKGLLTATLRYNTKTSYTLNSSARATISREASDELSIQANYSRRGFSFPLFGLELENDMEFSFLTSYRKNRRSTFDVLDFDNDQGRRLDGTTQITIEPRARYTISNKVTASAFLRYEGNFTEGASQPGFSTTQVGIDLRISVAGGR